MKTVYVNLLLLGIITGLLVGLNLMDNRAAFYSQIGYMASCEGIDKYYTGAGFGQDLHDAAPWAYYNNPDGFNILPPKDMGGFGWDCEDVSHFIYCLGKEYNITCKTYFMTYMGSRANPDYSDHVGVDCLLNETWVQFY